MAASKKSSPAEEEWYKKWYTHAYFVTLHCHTIGPSVASTFSAAQCFVQAKFSQQFADF
jgi:hypothetical protein